MYRIILAVVVLVLTSIWLSVVEWVTYTEEQLQTIEDRHYKWPRFKWDERIDNLARYAYTHCVERIGYWDIVIRGINYSCKDQSLTRTAENWAWGRWVVSWTNDHWICQLNYKYHKDFINDRERFEDPINQIHYCQEVREDAMRKFKMPRVAYTHRRDKLYLFDFQ